mgnify:CR=1 FL=1
MQAAACAGGGSSAEDQDDSPRWRPFRGRGKGRRRLRTAPAEAAAFPAAPQICAGIIGYVDFRQAPGGPEALLQECTRSDAYSASTRT